MYLHDLFQQCLRLNKLHARYWLTVIQLQYRLPIHGYTHRINIFIQMPYLLFTSYHIMQPRISPPPPKMATSSGLFLAIIYNQSQLTERKHVARYWLINTAAKGCFIKRAPPPLVITTKLAAAILGGGVVRTRRRCSAGPVLPLWLHCPMPPCTGSRYTCCQKSDLLLSQPVEQLKMYLQRQFPYQWDSALQPYIRQIRQH